MRLPVIEKIKNKFPKQEQLLQEFNHARCMRQYQKIATPEAAYHAGYFKLNEIAAAYRPETPIFLIELWLNSLELYLGFEKSKSSSQLAEIAYLMYREIHFFNIAEITLFFTRVKSGHYGEFYGSINGPSLIRWAREYRLERGKIVAKQPTTDFQAIATKIRKGLAEHNKKKEEENPGLADFS